MHRLLDCLAVWLAFLSISALAQGDWIWPSYANADNIEVTLGSYQTLRWQYDYKPFTLTIYQGPDADGGYAVQNLFTNRSTETSYTWQVQPLEGRPIDQCFHAGLTSPDPSSGGSFDSTEFCGVTAAAAGSSSSATKAAPSSSTTSASATSTSATTTSNSPTTRSTPTPPASSAPQNNGGDSPSTSNGVALGVGIGLGIPLALALGVLVGLYYRRRRRQPNDWPSETVPEMSHQQSATPAHVDNVEMSGGQQPVYGGGGMEDGQVYKQELPVEERRHELAADKYH